MIDYIGSADNIGHHHFRFQLIQNGIGADPMAVFCEISAIKGKPIKRKQMLKFHLVCFPVLCWRGSFCIAESLGEVAGRRKAQNSCDLRERKVRLGQETLSFFYAAVVFDVVINMAWPILKKKRWLPIAVMLAAFLATRFFSVNIILIILVCGVIGALDTLYLQKREDDK